MKSKVPLVSQAAGAVNAITGSIGDIVGGKNVFEGLGRIVSAPLAAAGSLGNQITFGKASSLPVAGGIFSGGAALNQNPYSKSAATELGQSAIKTAAVVGGTVVGGPALAKLLGSTSFTGSSLAAVTSSKLVQGDLQGVLDTAKNVAAPYVTAYVPQSVQDAYNTAAPIAAPFINQLLNPAQGGSQAAAPIIAPVNGIMQPSTLYSVSGGMNPVLIAAVAGVGLVFFMLAKKKRVL